MPDITSFGCDGAHKVRCHMVDETRVLSEPKA
jgi:hypothetical protein